jgi:hypothetical protein
MKIGVITDSVLLERRDDVGAAAALEHASLFPHEFERGANAALRQHLAQMFRGVVIRGRQVIFGIKPENDFHGIGGLRRRGLELHGCDQQQEDESNNFHKGEFCPEWRGLFVMEL